MYSNPFARVSVQILGSPSWLPHWLRSLLRNLSSRSLRPASPWPQVSGSCEGCQLQSIFWFLPSRRKIEKPALEQCACGLHLRPDTKVCTSVVGGHPSPDYIASLAPLPLGLGIQGGKDKHPQQLVRRNKASSVVIRAFLRRSALSTAICAFLCL